MTYVPKSCLAQYRTKSSGNPAAFRALTHCLFTKAAPMCLPFYRVLKTQPSVRSAQRVGRFSTDPRLRGINRLPFECLAVGVEDHAIVEAKGFDAKPCH